MDYPVGSRKVEEPILAHLGGIDPGLLVVFDPIGGEYFAIFVHHLYRVVVLFVPLRIGIGEGLFLDDGEGDGALASGVDSGIVFRSYLLRIVAYMESDGGISIGDAPT